MPHPYRRAALINLILFIGACKTEGTEPREPLHLKQEAVTVDVMAEPLALDVLHEISGFDADGEVQCLPLPEPVLGEPSACVTRLDPIDDECTAAKGRVLICQDCSRICSVGVRHAP